MRHAARLLPLVLIICGMLAPAAQSQIRLPSQGRKAQKATPPAPAPPAPEAAPGEPTFKVDVNLVTFPATVTDGYGRYVGSLRREQFTLYEDGTPQAISLFHNEIVPVSVGIIIDTSGSMENKIHGAADALVHFVNTIQPDDDVFLMRFSGTVELELDFTGNRELFARAAQSLEARGTTRLYDAVAEALEKIRAGRHKKKALLVITDGMDKSSQVTFEEVLQAARESEVLIYCMGIWPEEQGLFRRGRMRSRDEGVDMRVLEAFSDATGGRAFSVESAHHGSVDMIDRAAQDVSTELRQQYTVGYYPTNPARDGTYRKIRLAANVPGLQVRHRRGYYAPRESAVQAQR